MASDIASYREGAGTVPDPDDLEVRMAIIRGDLVPGVEIERLREALWAIVQETSNDPQRIKDMAREVLSNG